MSLLENLEGLPGVEFPVGVNYDVGVGGGGSDDGPEVVLGERTREGPLFVVAYPDEFEESTDEDQRKLVPDIPPKVAEAQGRRCRRCGLA
jgi:hypothetical protein